MITKITSENDLELFAPRFQEITEALAITNDDTRAAIITAVNEAIEQTFVNAKIMNTLESVIAEKKVRSINKDVLLDGFASALVEQSVETLKVIYREELAAETITEAALAQAPYNGLTEAEVNEGLQHIEDLAVIAVNTAKSVGLVVDSLETYFSNLDEIKKLQTSQLRDGKFLLVMPADEPYFEIDANARIINIPADFKKYGVGVYGDHFAELLVFKIDRYFDSQDFMNTQIAINWNFTPSGSRVPAFEETQAQAAFAKDDELEPGYVLFGFFVTKEMTPSKGTLSFSVTCYNTDNGDITYSFNTQVAQVAINDSLTLKDPTAVKDVSDEIISRLQSSAYTPSGVSPIEEPVWQLGETEREEDNSIKYLGLPAEMNFNMNVNGVEDDTLTIVTQAFTPGLSTMKYTWYSVPEDGNAPYNEIQGADVVTKPSDYFVTTDESMNNESVYYIKNDLGKFIVPESTTLAAAWDDPSVEVYELGSSYEAVTAGRYQVDAQASKITTRPNGTYIKTVSNLIHSNICIVPPAAKPEVSIVVESALTPENTDFEIYEENSEYIYIDASHAPTINAVITSTDPSVPLGAIALEAIESGEVAPLDAEYIIQNTKDPEDENSTGKYEFELLPESGEKQVNAAGVTEQGEYCVRAINRRNHTYSVSEPSEIVKTSFIAPKITKLNLYTLEENQRISVLEQGLRPAGVTNEEGVDIQLNRVYPTRTFVFDIDPSEPTYRDHIWFYVEELIKDPVTDEYVVAINSPSHDEGPEGERDEFKVVYDPEYIDSFHHDESKGAYKFEILDNDRGQFRIRTENYYNGTKRIGYTDIFTISTVR